MKFHELDPPKKQSSKRVGRGRGSGHGKTAGRGTKGQKARSGKKIRPGFEGGQTPLSKRLPKLRGFNKSTKPTQLVHTDQLNQFRANTTVTPEKLKDKDLIEELGRPIKVLKRGKITKKLTVKLPAASASAKEAIEAAGGTFTSA